MEGTMEKGNDVSDDFNTIFPNSTDSFTAINSRERCQEAQEGTKRLHYYEGKGY